MKKVLLKEQETIHPDEATRNFVYIAINTKHNGNIFLLTMNEFGNVWTPVSVTLSFNVERAAAYRSIPEALEVMLMNEYDVYQFGSYMTAFKYIIDMNKKNKE